MDYSICEDCNLLFFYSLCLSGGMGFIGLFLFNLTIHYFGITYPFPLGCADVSTLQLCRRPPRISHDDGLNAGHRSSRYRNEPVGLMPANQSGNCPSRSRNAAFNGQNTACGSHQGCATCAYDLPADANVNLRPLLIGYISTTKLQLPQPLFRSKKKTPRKIPLRPLNPVSTAHWCLAAFTPSIPHVTPYPHPGFLVVVLSF